MILNIENKPCSFRNIEEELIEKGLISYDNISSKTVERKLNEMVSVLGVLNCESIKRVKHYSINEDIFQSLGNEEIAELTTAVALFKNILFPVTAGYYCELSLKNYAKYERGMSLDIKDNFRYKNLHFHPVIEEQILWELLKAIHEKKYVSLDYNLPKSKRKRNENELLRPYKIRYDINCGRFYLVSYAKQNRCVVSRLDRIEKVEVTKYSYERDNFKELYMRDFKHSWSSVPLGQRNQPEKIKLEIIINEPEENYIIERIKSEV